MSGRYPNTSQHQPQAVPMRYTIGFYDDFEHLFARAEVTAAGEIEAITVAAKECGVTMSRVGRIEVGSADRDEIERFEAEMLADCIIPPMEAARLIAGEMYANAVQREIATPCETAEGTRLLREYRIATRHRADAAAKMLEAASLYAYEAFGNARAERDYQDQTLSILRGKLRDLGIDGGAL